MFEADTDPQEVAGELTVVNKFASNFCKINHYGCKLAGLLIVTGGLCEEGRYPPGCFCHKVFIIDKYLLF